MNQKSITLVSFGYFEEDFLKNIAEAVTHEFFLSVNIREGHLDLSEYYDPVRRQYNGTKLLNTVNSLYASSYEKTMGLFSVDLFIPILTYIFGQAFLSGSTGIASHYRLSNERYGLVNVERIVLERFKKEVIHELGHTFGLVHCHISTCVMRASTYVEDIDQKNESFCSECSKAFKTKVH
jgi:archaemetzincin